MTPRFEDVEGYGESKMATPDMPDMQEDEQMHAEAKERLHGYVDRSNFHRREAERYERMARAAAATIVEIEAHSPIATIEPEVLLQGRSPNKMPSSGAGQVIPR